MAELKTKPTDDDVGAFLDRIPDGKRRNDCHALVALMRQATKSEPKMWGGSIVGFGTYRYVYESGREGDWFLTGFSPRKRNLTLYVMTGFEQNPDLMASLGRYKTGKSCLYIDSLADIDTRVLKKLITASVDRLRRKK